MMLSPLLGWFRGGLKALSPLDGFTLAESREAVKQNFQIFLRAATAASSLLTKTV